MMRPFLFRYEQAALRWSRFGGVALYLPHAERADEQPAVYGAPRSFDSDGWAYWWAGKVGATFVETVNRGTDRQGIKLTREQAERMAEFAATGRNRPSLLTTVLYFTGTRRGATPEQIDALRMRVFDREVSAAHHGLCVGADHQFHDMIHRLKSCLLDVKPWLVGWPARVPDELTVVNDVRCDELRDVRPPLERNTAMAEDARACMLRGAVSCVELLACPAEFEQPPSGRGGTWHAIRAFRNAGIPVTVITPDGSERS